jgi:hypothetical protein
MTILKLILSTMIRNIKIKNIIDFIIVSNSIEHGNVFTKKINEVLKKNVSYIFPKFNGYSQIYHDVLCGSNYHTSTPQT